MQVIFLHVFHHAMMTAMPYAWLSASWCAQLPSQHSTRYFPRSHNTARALVWFGCLINTAIHVFMYFYFAGAALNGYRPWWRQLLTTMQIGQFLLVLVSARQACRYLSLSKSLPLSAQMQTAIIAFQLTYAVFDVPCTAGDSWVIWYSQSVNVVFLYCFLRFFFNAYSTKTPAPRSNQRYE